MRLEKGHQAVGDVAGRVHRGAPQEPLVALVGVEADALDEDLRRMELAGVVHHALGLALCDDRVLRRQRPCVVRHEVNVRHGDGVAIRAVDTLRPGLGLGRPALIVHRLMMPQGVGGAGRGGSGRGGVRVKRSHESGRVVQGRGQGGVKGRGQGGVQGRGRGGHREGSGGGQREGSRGVHCCTPATSKGSCCCPPCGAGSCRQRAGG